MGEEKTNDRAEPSPASDGSVASAGTLRDTFAAAALTGLLSSLPNGDQYHSFAVEKAWSLADAMLCERERRRCPVSSQENLTLTGSEREAINMSRKILVSDPSMNPAQRAEWAITLSRLLDRTGFAQ